MDKKDAKLFRQETQSAIDSINPFPAHSPRILLSSDTGKANHTDLKHFRQKKDPNDFSWETINLLVRLWPVKNTVKSSTQLHPSAPILFMSYNPDTKPGTEQWSSAVHSLSEELLQLFERERDTLSRQLPASFTCRGTSKLSPSELAEEKATRVTNSFNHAPIYHLTFSLFTPEYKPSAWEVEQALQEHIYPLLDSFAAISKFTVDSQIQLYAKFSPLMKTPEYDQSRKAWTLRTEDLSGFVNAAEWPLSPSIDKGPTINFVLYVPSESQTPLVLQENGGNSWLIPQWGGVFIHNPSEKSHPVLTSLDKESLKPAMLKFAQQLFSFLGLPESSDPLSLRLSSMSKLRIASLLVSASSTLGALARLTESRPSIAIPDSVAKSVDETILQLQSSYSYLQDGNHEQALESARIAESEAEKAFFDPSMVGQVYFPEEHKVAVYLPLLGPMAVPLFMAAFKELRRTPT